MAKTGWIARVAWLPAAALIAATLGCGAGPEMAPVEGTVTLDGKPLEFGLVMLHPLKGQVAQGLIGAGGAFSLSTFEPGDGVPFGAYRVSVLCYEGHDPSKASAAKGPEEGFLLGRSLIPLRYSRATSSGLTVDVGPDGVRDLTLALSSRK
ncbi:hypothetical protein Pla175_29630 [Pirellulimonas nuda]|uniref:Carboxypeptidase regulatory-like domain-containing protein n=1 Tax=Pirellulimonas nuda TaxID=2528009 RepID=A0A518DDL2_9BACT|nr:hypothetical protein [Pirellulimonas nuda]QDU89571.1 hypothetical protein Pla175_29630 [Pirellulimonas nuda]